MEKGMFSVLFFVICVCNCHGNLPILFKFLQDFNFQHLDSINIESIEFEQTDQQSDETWALFTEEFQNFQKFTSFQKQDNCSKPAIKAIPMDSIMALNNTVCQKKGLFIRDTCQSYLIYAFENILLDEIFISKLKCNLIFQPIVYTLMKTHPTAYNLYEIQVISNRYIHLASWNIKENVMRYVKTKIMHIYLYYIHRSNSSQVSTFNFKHFICNEFPTFFGNAGI